MRRKKFSGRNEEKYSDKNIFDIKVGVRIIVRNFYRDRGEARKSSFDKKHSSISLVALKIIIHMELCHSLESLVSLHILLLSILFFRKFKFL